MSDAPERIKAWVWNLDYPSKKNGSAEWNATMFPADQDCHEYIRADLAAPDLAELVEALGKIAEAKVVTNSTTNVQTIWALAEIALAALAKIKEPQT